jgi:hypothetical protein
MTSFVNIGVSTKRISHHTPLAYNWQLLLLTSIKNLANAQAKLRGLMISRRAAVRFSLWLGSINKKRRISGAKLIDWDRV